MFKTCFDTAENVNEFCRGKSRSWIYGRSQPNYTDTLGGGGGAGVGGGGGGGVGSLPS